MTKKKQTLSVKQALDIAANHHNANRLAEAENIYRKVLEKTPNQEIALHHLGLILHQKGESKRGITLIEKALSIKPDYEYALNNIGKIYLDLGNWDIAAINFKKAINYKPDFDIAHNNYANAMLFKGRINEAITAYQKTLSVNPKYAEAAFNLGSAYKALGNIQKAISSYERAIAINPKYAEAYNNLGNIFSDIYEYDAAQNNLNEAIRLKSDFAYAHNNLGNVYKDLNRFSEAMECFNKSININKNFAEAYNNLGNVLKDLGKYNEAIEYYNKAIKIRAGYTEARSNILFVLNFLSVESQKIVTEAKNYGELVKSLTKGTREWKKPLKSPSELKIGFVSGDLNNHPVGHFIENLIVTIAKNENSKLKLIAYYNQLYKDNVTERIKKSFYKWHSVYNLSDQELAALIRKDEINILIDLSGHSAKNRLPVFAWKPAPIQASWLGYFATTGVNEIDYFIADKWTAPKSEEQHFTEKIWRLPETYWCFTQPAENTSIDALPALKNKFITFGCFNDLSKINSSIISLWSRIMHEVPNSKLFLKNKQASDLKIRKNTLSSFSKHGICTDRIIMEGYTPRAEYLESYNRVDIALDPFPYPGGTTTIEGLWMGVPIITKKGNRFLSHAGETIANNAGLQNWIAKSDDDYVEKAIINSSDFDRLNKLRLNLRSQVISSPLFYSKRFSQVFEEAVWGMWSKW